MAGNNYAQLIVNTTSYKATEALLDKYEPLYSERFPGAFVKFKQLDYQSYNPFEYLKSILLLPTCTQRASRPSATCLMPKRSTARQEANSPMPS